MCMLKKLNKNEKKYNFKKRERTKKEWAKGEEEPHKNCLLFCLYQLDFSA